MEFVKAPELKNKFSVFGHFYKLRIGEQLFNCRSVLEITSVRTPNVSSSAPCAVVVMMNPGSSTPKDPNYIEKEYLPSEIRSRSWIKEIIPANPDPAQYQIMRLMLKRDWHQVRILNLSDLRNGNSGDFSVDYSEAYEIDPTSPHCITDVGRWSELFQYCNEAPYIIAAWGREKVLLNSAQTFMDKIECISGIATDYPCYYYASPSRYDYKIYWLENVNSTIKQRNITIGSS